MGVLAKEVLLHPQIVAPIIILAIMVDIRQLDAISIKPLIMGNLFAILVTKATPVIINPERIEWKNVSILSFLS